MQIHPGQTVTSNGVPLQWIGDIQLNQGGMNKQFAVVSMEGGSFIKGNLHVSKFLIPITQIDGMVKQDIEVVA